jgi:hypothetical protein
MKPITFWGLCAAGGALIVAAACSAGKVEAPANTPATTAATPASTSAADFRTTATIKDIMDSVVDPSADFIWDSVSTIVTRKGIDERRPRTDMEWKEVRRRAIALVEATNLLIMDGRKVAKPGEKSENPEVELGPDDIQGLIDADTRAWSSSHMVCMMRV